MDRALVAAFCRTLPGADCTDPWGGGHAAWKVGGKMFACVGATDDGVSVKTPDIETAQMLIEAGAAERAPYFHRSWVRLPWTCDKDELHHRLAVSYDIIRAGLTKRLHVSLPPRD
jgi:predicted DNA-binding protein (MmcQ/YjbR family)